MALYKPSELRAFLHSHQLFPKKGLSQNFLIDGNIVRKIVATAKIEPGDLVLEIGPGPGVLTEALLAAGAKVIAVEKDIKLAQQLSRLDLEGTALQVLSEDVLRLSLEDLLARIGGKKAKLIANLPYHITTPILTRFVPLASHFSSIIIMVQEEVARRFVALPNCSDYSSLTLFLNFFSNPKYEFNVSANCFFPVPKVNSAIATLELKKAPLPEEKWESFFQMTRTAFCHRRKMLRASLKGLYPVEKILQSLKMLKLSEETRPEQLALNQWLDLFELLRT